MSERLKHILNHPDCVRVIARDNPFEDFRLERLMRRKMPLMKMAKILYKDKFEVFKECGVIHVNGVPVDRDIWEFTRPKQSVELVTMYIVPGKTSTLLLTLAAVALTVATAGIAAGGIATVFGLGAASTFAAGGLGAALAAAGVGIVGSLALNALTPPPIAPNLGGTGGQRQIAGIAINPLSRLDYLPSVLGRMRVSPPLLSYSYTTLENGEVFANGIVGLAGAYDISSIQINGTDITLFPDVEYSIRQGLESDTAPSQNFADMPYEARPNLKMSEWDLDADTNDLVDQSTPANSVSDYHYFTVPAPGDLGRVVIRLWWPQGLGTIQPDNDVANGGVPIRIEIKPKTSSTWYRLPDLHFRGHNKDEVDVRQQITLQWATALTSATLTPNTSFHAWAAYWKYAPAQAFERTSEAVYTGATEEYAKGVTRDGKEGFIIDILNSAVDGDQDFDIRIRAGTSFTAGSFSTTTHEYGGSGPLGASFFDYYDDAGTKSVVSKQSAPGNNRIIESVGCFKPGDPFDWHGIASISFKARGLQIDSLSAIFHSIVPIYDANTWSVTSTATSNPSALYRNVLFGPLNTEQIPGEIVRQETLVDWYQDCIDRELECNAVIQNMSVPQVLQLIAAAGWAVPRQSDFWEVIIERDRTAEPVIQMISPLNSQDLGTSKEFARLPHAIRAEYFDEDDEWRLKDDVTAYAPGHGEDTANRVTVIRYAGITDRLKVQARVQLDLDQIYKRQTRYRRKMFFEGLICKRGDLVALNDEVIVLHHSYSWIQEVITSGGNVTGLILEGVVDLTTGNLADPFETPSMGAAIRLNSGQAITHLVNESQVANRVTFTTPFADTGVVQAGQLVVFGATGLEALRCIVFSIERANDDTAILTLMDERPDLHA